jgi:hypothetical protein
LPEAIGSVSSRAVVLTHTRNTMKKLLVVASLAFSAFLTGCGSPNCDALKAQCDACTNATGKSSCQTTYNTYTAVGGSTADTSCKAVVDAKTYDKDGSVCK